MPTQPRIIRTNIKIGDSSQQIIYNDEHVVLKLQVSWNNDNLTGATLELTNVMASPRFELCEIHRCQGVFPSFTDYLIMHTSKNTSVQMSTKSIAFNPAIAFDVGKEYRIIFKVYPDSCSAISNLNCQFDGNTPDSKDGAIIIGAR